MTASEGRVHVLARLSCGSQIWACAGEAAESHGPHAAGFWAVGGWFFGVSGMVSELFFYNPDGPAGLV